MPTLEMLKNLFREWIGIPKNTYILCGVSTAIAANSGSPTACITIPNKTGSDVLIKALSIRYKSTLVDCLVEFETPASKNDPLFFGNVMLGGIGLPSQAPTQNEWYLPGDTQTIKKGENLVFNVQTFATAVTARDISLVLVVEEIPEKRK